MNKTIVTLILGTSILSGCQTYNDDYASLKRKNSLCAGINATLNRAVNSNTSPNQKGVVTAADRSHLIKEYNQLGCNQNSDNEYRNPYDSLPLNAEINNK